ncbi:MAG TPA: hypothetical protein VFY81_01215 [Gammaproteobacteria bacterium]|nr:hypothetical protein [Gammaproteobacteria bacterium]
MEHKPTQGLYGWITHVDIASSDPAASKEWCEAVLGWNFMANLSTPAGEYHLFSYSEKGGGGIRALGPIEAPGCVPFVHVANTQEAFEKAIREGAVEVNAPTKVMEGVTTALVRAPGGFLIGFSGP